MDDRQRHRSLRGAQGLVVEDVGLALDHHLARDGERPGDLLGEVHEHDVGEVAPLRMPADEVTPDRIDLPQFVHGLGHQRRALAIGAGEAAVGAPAHEVDVGVIEPGVVAQVGGGFAVEAQDQVILGDVGPGLGDGGHVGLAVHVRPVEDDDRRPSLRVALLVALGGADAVGEQVLGGPVDDLAGLQRGVPANSDAFRPFRSYQELDPSSRPAPSSVLPSLLRSNQPLPLRSQV